MDANDIMALIKSELDAKSITNYAVAKKMKVSRSTVANWFDNKTYPNLPQLLELLSISEKKIKIN